LVQEPERAVDGKEEKMRCVLCSEAVEAGDLDVVEVGGGIVHGDCLAEREDEGLFDEPVPESAATGRAAASFECSLAELERERRARAVRRSKERKAG
jgi:hypothetical protein